MKPKLIVMAAGLGSRFGGLKQMENITPEGEIILDFAAYDAIKAGFEDIIFVIKEEMVDIFTSRIMKRIEPFANVSYAVQKCDRKKPYGTCHAVMAAKELVGDAPFAVINSDDYYGPSGFKSVFDFLCSDNDPDTYCMAGYMLENTLSDTGTVTRGVCCADENGYLTKVVETKGIGKDNDYPKGTLVSMNFWGFKSSMMKRMEEGFSEFMKNAGETNEYLLPIEVGKYLDNGLVKVKVIPCDETWYGVTYKEDKPLVSEAFEKMKKEGKYPRILWEK